MTIQLYANNAKTTLASAITSTQTTIAVAPGTGSLFPSPVAGVSVFQLTLVSASSSSVYEICTCTARSGDTLTVVRGQEGTSGQPFILNDIVGNYDTAKVMGQLVQAEQLQAQTYQYGVAAGTANALTATVPSTLTSLPDGMYINIKAATANTAAATLNLTLGSTVLGALPIVKGNNLTLVAGDIASTGYPLQLNWSATFNAFVLQNPATGIFVASVPTGSIAWFPATTAPSGYLIASGQLVSRSTYASLWSYAQSSGNLAASDGAWQSGQFSPGDGSTTFRLPQLGGYFIRNLDNGNGIDPGRTIGTVQSGQNAAHNHTATSSSNSTSVVTDPGHNHTYNNRINELPQSGSSTNCWYGDTNATTSTSTTGITVATTTTTSTSIANQGGNEARPINISLLCCIKY